MVFKKKIKGSKLITFASRGIVNAPYATIAEFIKDADSSFVWDKFLVVNKVYFAYSSSIYQIIYPQEAKYLKTYTQSSTHIDYLGAVINNYHILFKFLLWIFIAIQCAYIGYQMHSASHCFSLVQRDMLYFLRCIYIVSA